MTPRVQYSNAERRAARLTLAKSRFFLILGQLGDEHNPVPPVICTCARPNALLRVIRLQSKDKRWSHDINARIGLELRGRQSPKTRIAAANKIVSAVGALFTFVHHTTYQDIVPYQIPKGLIRGNTVQVRLLERLDDLTIANPIDHRMFLERLGSSVIIPDQSMAMIFYLLPFVTRDEDLFNACSFFRSCCSEYSFMDGVVREILYDRRREPTNEAERLGLENVVLQAFRTIEAIVGEPGKERRFREHLEARGLNYDERVGFGRRRRSKLGARIQWLQEARDSAAAHGKRRRQNPFTFLEAMEAQHLAESVLNRALWFTAETLGRVGDRAEIAFLLSAVFPHPSDESWVSDRRVFEGRSAVDLAEIPNGLRTVVNYYERLHRIRRPRTALD